MAFDLETIAPLVEEYQTLSAKKTLSPDEKKKKSEIEKSLNSFYWTELNAILDQCADMDELRLIIPGIDQTLLDTAAFTGKLFEHYQGIVSKDNSPDAPFQILYFSEWLVEKFQEAVHSKTQKESQAENLTSSILRSLLEFRLAIYRSIAFAFNNVPGLNEETRRSFLMGQLDSQREDASLRLLMDASPTLYTQRNKVAIYIQGVLGKVRSTIKDEKTLGLFERLSNLNQKIYSEKKLLFYISNPEFVAHQSQVLKKVEKSELLDILATDLKRLKASFFLGVEPAEAVKVDHFVLEERAMTTKSLVLQAFQHVQDCDLKLPGFPHVLILPYSVHAFYQWDTDTIFLPAVPKNDPEMEAFRGYASYRYTFDITKDGGMIKKVYETEFKVKDFRTAFLRDYIAWVKNYGNGRAEGLEGDRETLFKKLFGPDLTQLVPTPLYRMASAEEREHIFNDCFEHIKQGSTVRDHYYNMICHLVSKQRMEYAWKLFLKLVETYPKDGFVLLNLAIFCIQKGDKARAAKLLEHCQTKAGNTIWAIYAGDLKRELAAGEPQ